MVFAGWRTGMPEIERQTIIAHGRLTMCEVRLQAARERRHGLAGHDLRAAGGAARGRLGTARGWTMR